MIHAITIFLGAFLLFQVELIIGKYILPWYGGAPAVWTTCLLFFQAVVLAGYGYAHGLARRPRRRQVWIHTTLIVVSVLVLLAQGLGWGGPILAGTAWKPLAGVSNPVPSIMWLLAVSVGLFCFVLSTGSPLLQHWNSFSRGASSYKLYALSNLGSLIGLVGYPFVVEPAFSLKTQALMWSAAFLFFAAGTVLCAFVFLRCPVSTTSENAGGAQKNSPGKYALWFLLSACGSALLMADTNMMCQDIAVVPFLWVLPLTLYLLTFIVSFADDRLYSRRVFFPLLFVSTIGVCWVMLKNLEAAMPLQIGALALVLFSGCMVCHGELALLKPGVRSLTAYYLAVAAGGVAGGLFVALAAPLLFNGYWEFHAALWLCWTLAFLLLMLDRQSSFYHGHFWAPFAVILAGALVTAFFFAPQWATPFRALFGPYLACWYFGTAGLAGILIVHRVYTLDASSFFRPQRAGWVRIGMLLFWAILLFFMLMRRAGFYEDVIVASRNFYGVLRVTEDDGDNPAWRHFSLRHGRILHGLQLTAPEKRNLPSTYYTEDSGIGRVMRARAGIGPEGMNVGAVGLGVGTIAVYLQPSDRLRFYEINPEVIRIARNTNYFTFISRSPGGIGFAGGDGRLSLEQELRESGSRQFDVLAVDAFSGDSIPAHLLTREAFELYRAHLKPEGRLCVHISNRYLDLRPVVESAAAALGWRALCMETDESDERTSESTWMILSASGPGEEPQKDTKRLWTDDYSNLFDCLK